MQLSGEQGRVGASAAAATVARMARWTSYSTPSSCWGDWPRSHVTVTSIVRMIGRTKNALVVVMLLGLVALEAVWIDFGRLHRSQNADSFLLVLISLQKLTVFYWGQDRLGMLVPLVSSVIRHPLANLLVQSWMTTSAALLSPFLAARYLLEDWRDWFPVGAAANVLLLLLATPEVQFDWFVNQPYGVAFALGCGGLLVLERRGVMSLAAAAICIVAAHWVNVSIFFLLALLVPAGGQRHGAKVLAPTMLAIGVLLGVLMSSAADAPHTTSATMPLSQWPAGWLELTRKAVTVFGSQPRLIATLVLSLAGAAAAAVTRGSRRTLRISASCLAIAIVYGLIVGTFEWVRLNLFYPRYVFPSLMFMGLAVATTLLAPFHRYPRVKAGVCGLMLVAVTMVTAGMPSLQAIEHDFDERFGRMSEAVVQRGARLIGGEYWTVWPAVFHANLTLARHGSSDMVYGLAYRLAPTDPIWRSMSAPVVLVAAPHDATVVNRAARANASIALIEHGPVVDVYSVTGR